RPSPLTIDGMMITALSVLFVMVTFTIAPTWPTPAGVAERVTVFGFWAEVRVGLPPTRPQQPLQAPLRPPEGRRPDWRPQRAQPSRQAPPSRRRAWQRRPGFPPRQHRQRPGGSPCAG